MSVFDAQDCTCWGDHNGFMTNPQCILHGDERKQDRERIRDAGNLTFKNFSHISMERHLNWPRNGSGKKPVSHEWTLSDWGIAAAEEMGEVCGAIKRINRIEAGHIINGKPGDFASQNREAALAKLRKEIGDTVTYLDLLAQEAGTTLEESRS